LTGSAPDPAEGAYSVPPDPVAGLRGPTSKEREGKWEGRGDEGKEKGECLTPAGEIKGPGLQYTRA